jgi:hypothetical protein
MEKPAQADSREAGRVGAFGEGVVDARRIFLRQTPTGFVCAALGGNARLLHALVNGDADNPFVSQCRQIAQNPEDSGIAKAGRPLAIAFGSRNDPLFRRLAVADALLKAGYNPNEPRDWHGRWTNDGAQPGPDDGSTASPDGRAGAPAGNADLAGTAAAFSSGGASATSLFGAAGPVALRGLASIGTGLAAFLGALVFTTDSGTISEGTLPGHPEIGYRFDAETGGLTLFKNNPDGSRRSFFDGPSGGDYIFRDNEETAFGREVAGRVILDADAVASLAAHGVAGTSASASQDQDRPKLCPDPTAENIAGRSERSLRYQEQITGLQRGLEIVFNGERYDGCRPENGNLLEAKSEGYTNFLGPDGWYDWFTKLKSLQNQMESPFGKRRG